MAPLVWIVQGADKDYYGHGEHILGVFATEEEAGQFINNMKNTFGKYEDLSICSFMIGEYAPVDTTNKYHEAVLECLVCKSSTLEKG